MTYEPKTEEGKKMIADGADPEVVKGVEDDAGIEKKSPEHVEKPEENPEDKPVEVVPEETEEPIDRTPQHMPIWKHKEELKKREQELQEEFQVKLQEAARKPDGATNEDVNKLAEEFNLTPEVASSMIDKMAQVVSSKIGIDDIRKDNEQRKEEARQRAEEQGFENEWKSDATTKAIEALAGDKPITEQIKQRVKEFAYSTTYAKYRIADIVRLESENIFLEKPSESRPAEKSRGGAARGSAQKSIVDMSTDEINSLSDEEFIKMSNELGKQGSKYGRITRVKR